MRKRQLGKNGPDLTVIGFGSWAIGGPWEYGWGPVNDDDSIKAIRRAFELGINWIDTAAEYGLGHSEEVVAKAVEPFKKEIFVATKCGHVWDEKAKVTNNLQPASIRRELEASLRRLKTDCIDLYQFHWPDPNSRVEDSWETVVQLKNEGKIRFIGMSNFDVPLLQRCEVIHHVQSLQPRYNFIEKGIEKDILPYCDRTRIGVVAYSPMLSGLLTGQFEISRLAPDDWRWKYEMFQESKLSQNLALVEKLRPIAAEYGKTVGQLAVAWVLRNPVVTSAIVGARNPKQIEENVAADFEISGEHMASIQAILDENMVG